MKPLLMTFDEWVAGREDYWNCPEDADAAYEEYRNDWICLCEKLDPEWQPPSR